MTNGWEFTTLGQEVDLLTGFPFKSNQYSQYKEDIRLLRGDNIIQGCFRWDDVKRWHSSEAYNLAEYFLKAGDIVLAMDRPWIEAGLKYACVSEYDLPCLLVQRVARLRAKKGLDQRFLRYIIGSSAFSKYVVSIQTGTAVPHISGGQIKAFQFLIPPLSIQQHIADILGALDDKIECNRRINQTLEEMARALYKHWFVDFGPFRQELWSTKLGDIPTGWKESTLKASCDVLMGQSPPSKLYNMNGEGLAFHQGVTNFGWRYPKHTVYCTDLARVAEAGSIMFSVRAPVGRINVANRRIVIGRGIAAISHKQGWNSFLLYQLKTLFAAEDSIGSGTIFNAVTKGELENFPVILPPDDEIKRFNDLASLYDKQIEANEIETQTLICTRDYLLPKLLSGEIEIKAAEKQLAEHV